MLPPDCLYRMDSVARTPVVRGRIRVAPAFTTADEQELTAEVLGAQEYLHQKMLHASPSYYAAEMLSGPPFPPYNGKFLIGKHHIAWDELVQRQTRICSLAPRDHGKSWWWSLALPIWKADLNQPGSEGYLFSASQDLAEDLLSRIRREVESNDRLAHLVPTNERLLTKRELILGSGTRIRARGWGTRVRGGHPQWIICDDVLDDTSLYSETKRSRSIDFFFSVPTNMVEPGGLLALIGTPFHAADLYASVKSTRTYHYVVFPARDERGEPLFPQRYNNAALKRKEQEIKAARFAREFMCVPLSDEASLFPSRLFEGEGVRLPYVLGLPGSYWHERGCSTYAGVDVAMSAEIGSDYFVIFVVAVDADHNRWVVDIIRKHGLGFTAQLTLAKECHTKYGLDAMNIEANQAQRWLPDELARTTNLPIRRFFTSGVQPKKPWRQKMTSLTMGKHNLDRGVPSIRMSLEEHKWRIPRGDERSIEETDIWIGEMGCITMQGGQVLSVGEHDDTVMACWMANTAVLLGGGAFEFGIQDQPNVQDPTEKDLREEVARLAEGHEKGEELFDPFGLGEYKENNVPTIDLMTKKE